MLIPNEGSAYGKIVYQETHGIISNVTMHAAWAILKHVKAQHMKFIKRKSIYNQLANFPAKFPMISLPDW